MFFDSTVFVGEAELPVTVEAEYEASEPATFHSPGVLGCYHILGVTFRHRGRVYDLWRWMRKEDIAELEESARKARLDLCDDSR